MINPGAIEATSFTLEGQRLTYDNAGNPVFGEQWTAGPFRCLPEIPARALNRLASSVGTNARGEQVVNQLSVVDFLKDVIIPPDRDLFDALLDDDERQVPLEKLVEVMSWVTEELGQRPSGR